jgi:hypothetical protein
VQTILSIDGFINFIFEKEKPFIVNPNQKSSHKNPFSVKKNSITSNTAAIKQNKNDVQRSKEIPLDSSIGASVHDGEILRSLSYCQFGWYLW